MLSGEEDPHKITVSTWTSRTLGENIGSVWKVCILACIVLMLADAVSRWYGKKLFNNGVFYLVRFIWFIYGTSILYIAGHKMELGYRGFIQDIYGEF
jgi:hypothetical protein